VSGRKVPFTTGATIEAWSTSWSWYAMSESRRTPQPRTSIGTVSMNASAIPDMAWVSPAPGTTLTHAIRPEARQTPSAMKDADCSSVTSTGRTVRETASSS